MKPKSLFLHHHIVYGAHIIIHVCFNFFSHSISRSFINSKLKPFSINMPNSNTSYVKFQDCWLKDSAFKPWLKRSGASNNEAECIICKKLVDFKSMGRSALVSHMKGKKHISLTAASKTTDFGR